MTTPSPTLNAPLSKAPLAPTRFADAAPLVEVANLKVVARGEDGREFPIVKDVSFSVKRGEVVALIGESGSGKTTIALSVMGYARSGCRIAGGRVRLGDCEVTALSESGLADLRGRRVAYIAQSAAAAFNPSRTIMAQVIESALIHKTATKAEAEVKARALFTALALPDPDGVGDRYPHQVSGGQLQRLLAAMALITDPELVIFDEPTTALDVTTQIEVLKAFKAVVRDRDTTGLYVSHDLAVVAQVADRIVVLRDGAIREVGATGQIIEAPRDDYTRSLIAAAEPQPRAAAPLRETPAPLLEVTNLSAGYGGLNADGMPHFPILDAVGFRIQRGSTLGVIGESGCGKSTLARVVAGLMPAARGAVTLDGRPLPPTIAGRSREDLRRIQIVFQMADTALNPAHSVSKALSRPLTFYHGLTGAVLDRRVFELLDLVKLPRGLADRKPGELSGGQKQRINLARALAAEPDLILCDEVTSALDTVVAAAVLDLLVELRRDLGVSYMFISHDLKTVRAICDDIMVLYAGRKVQAGSREAMAEPPSHPYADLLTASVPEMRMGWLEGAGAHASNFIDPADKTKGGKLFSRSGCAFYPRCPLGIAGTCDRERPPLRVTPQGSEIACHRSDADLMSLTAR
ncbi:ABC transporter ATP-binding protein [Azospirillum cavernae]|uniref:ABC transporter ATP-binding protein n=1 Tax=Azospirillum cavernae TaxID=2320860 RepID=A0A418VW12_9PROT|nr:ABC transporter ATP-binding protein [Azospirillum cavernae]RJF81345.1 ABC transporter ATP-binding protein [Azospirillum cavernae]